MCLILVAWRTHPRYPLVVAANRDELFARPTAPAAFWTDPPGLLAGRDLTAGGTWLGITASGRFAALTNYRDPAQVRANAPSRGMLVSDFLAAGASPHQAALSLAGDKARAYSGFNLLLADREDLYWVSNVTGQAKRLDPGIYGLSNEVLDTPWPKVEQSKSALAAALGALPDDSALFRLLLDDTVYPDHLLPRTGVNPEWERLLSAAFVRGPDYGTRSSTVVLRDVAGNTIFDEQTWLVQAKPGPRHRFRFQSL